MEDACKRSDFGSERYEVVHFQKEVQTFLLSLQDETWRIIDATRTVDEIHHELCNDVCEIIEHYKDLPLKIFMDMTVCYHLR